jgi:hypothetical protein
MVKVKFSHPHDGNEVGDQADVDEVEARMLIRAGVAVAATVPDAKAAGVDPETAATKR